MKLHGFLTYPSSNIFGNTKIGDVLVTLIYTSSILQRAQAIEVFCLFLLLPLLPSATKKQLSQSKWMNIVGAYLEQFNFQNGLCKHCRFIIGNSVWKYRKQSEL